VTDGRTDGQTDRQKDRILLAIPRLHYMQRGKKDELPIETQCITNTLLLHSLGMEQSSGTENEQQSGEHYPSGSSSAVCEQLYDVTGL